MNIKTGMTLAVLAGAFLISGCRDVEHKNDRPEDKAFVDYLCDIYQKNDIVNGFPVETDVSEYYGSWTSYKKYAIADFDGDGRDELLLQKYGPYNGGFFSLDEEGMTDAIYPYFDMYELDESGKVADRDTEPYKTHGDLWLMYLPRYFRIENSGFHFYDNAVFRYHACDDDGNETDGYYIFDDDIYRQLGVLGHKLYTDYDYDYDYSLGEDSVGSAICYTFEKDGTIVRKVGSHQDAAIDRISKEDYDAEVNVLRGGKELDTAFKDMNAENLGLEKREDTLESNTRNAEITGLDDITLTGTVVRDDTVTDAAGNPDPVIVLKPDRSFIYLTGRYNGEVFRVDEVQLGVDALARDSIDLNSFEGKSVTVTGTTFPATTVRHHRPMVMLVKEIK